MAHWQQPLKLMLLVAAPVVLAAGAIEGEIERQALNPVAIIMFLVFVAITLGISYWASRRTQTSKDFYTAGGDITGLQNGTAIAGDFMSAASLLGVSGLIFLSGFDGLIYAIARHVEIARLAIQLSHRSHKSIRALRCLR